MGAGAPTKASVFSIELRPGCLLEQGAQGGSGRTAAAGKEREGV